MKRTKLQKALATIAPWISIRTIWEHDNDCGPISKECDGFKKSDDRKWQAWQSNVCATASVNGEELEGNAYLGGTFEKAGDIPEESNPTISGYENQMTVEALEELGRNIVKSKQAESGLLVQISSAIEHCKREAQISYDKQRAETVASNSRWTRPNITPGSWRQNSVAVRHDIHDVLAQDGATIAFIPENKGPHRMADGKAIAALPDLLTVLEGILIKVAITDHGEIYIEMSRDQLKVIKSALTKAGYRFFPLTSPVKRRTKTK